MKLSFNKDFWRVFIYVNLTLIYRTFKLKFILKTYITQECLKNVVINNQVGRALPVCFPSFAII